MYQADHCNNADSCDYLMMEEIIPTFYTDDPSWCPVYPFQWYEPMNGMILTPSEELMGTGNTPDPGCESIMNLIATWNITNGNGDVLLPLEVRTREPNGILFGYSNERLTNPVDVFGRKLEEPFVGLYPAANSELYLYHAFVHFDRIFRKPVYFLVEASADQTDNYAFDYKVSYDYGRRHSIWCQPATTPYITIFPYIAVFPHSPISNRFFCR
ncbi:hypothetical protein GQ53DRAFT_772716 [Thozetella sp. PMI_491]|nr:hypothetical protein GQ53DRAFT_772716 [Thozetella sp. PMI_491]